MANIKTTYNLDKPDGIVECGRGWFLVQNEENGLYYPFFIKVREDDIVWDMEFPREKLKYAIDQFAIDGATMFRPGSKYVLTGRADGDRYGKIESWVVTLYKDLTAEFQKHIILDSECFEEEELNKGRKLTMKVKLPFRISASDKRNFNLNIVKNINVENPYDPFVASVINTRMIKEYDETDTKHENPFYQYVLVDFISLSDSIDTGILPHSAVENSVDDYPYSIYFNMSGKVFNLNENTELFQKYFTDLSEKKNK